VGVDAAQVGGEQDVGGESGVLGGHAAQGEHARAELVQRSGRIYLHVSIRMKANRMDAR